MKLISYDKVTGDIMSYLEVPVENTRSLETPSIGFIEVSEFIDIQCKYIKNGKIEDRPKKPFAWYRWDGNGWYNPKTINQEWDSIRIERDVLLQKSDWTQLPDVPLPTKEKWAVYRQALRDITQQPDPFNIVWPEPPQ